MALNGTEFLIIGSIMRSLSKNGRPRVLSLGYPDLLFGPQLIAQHFAEIDTNSLKLLNCPWAISSGIKTTALCDAASLFAAFNADLEIMDCNNYGHSEQIANLSDPIPPVYINRYDLIIDPGTLEHCFNIATAISNIASMVKIGGYAYHQTAITFCGHGFYCVSPTFFVDFYLHNGFSISHPRCWGVGSCEMDDLGRASPLRKLDFTKEYATLCGNPAIGVYLSRKIRSQAPVFPIQCRYAPEKDKNISLGGFDSNLEDMLSICPQVLGGDIDVPGNKLV